MKKENNTSSYLGFDWVSETIDAIQDFLDEELSCGNKLPNDPETLTEKLCIQFGGSEYPEICSVYDHEIYEAVVSNMDLVDCMYREWGTTLSAELDNMTLLESAHKIGTQLQEYLIKNFTNFSNEEYLNLTSSINERINTEELQSAIYDKGSKFMLDHKDDVAPIISNPLTLEHAERVSLDDEISGARSASKEISNREISDVNKNLNTKER